MNVTPFIDVLLVDTQPRSVRSVIDHTIMIEYTADRRLSINYQDVLEDLEARLRDVYGECQEFRVWGGLTS